MGQDNSNRRINPHISIDCVLFGYDGEELKVLLVQQVNRQGGQPAERMKLPGSLIYDDEDLDEAVRRVLYELTGLKNINMSLLNNVIILCGHYKGIDYRIREHLITKEISVGDYVLTGGELAAAIITDAVVRLIPGAIGDEQSALSDSFQDGLLAPPVYTRPADYNGWKVPDILLSGNERKIEEWRLQQAQERTARLRPDLLK